MEETKKERRKEFWKTFIIYCLGAWLGNFVKDLINVGQYIENSVGKFCVEVIIISMCLFIVERIATLIGRLRKKNSIEVD